MPVKIVTLLQLFLFVVSLGLFVMAALTFTRRRQARQSGLLVLAMCAEAFYCVGYAGDRADHAGGSHLLAPVEYIGIPWIPALWVLIGRRFDPDQVHQPFLVSRLRAVFVFGVPFVSSHSSRPVRLPSFTRAEPSQGPRSPRSFGYRRGRISSRPWQTPVRWRAMGSGSLR
jgi:hypothetical protein